MIYAGRFALQIFIVSYFFETALAQENTPGATSSIYEVGDSITTYESNFENLFNNWTEKNITNADEYKFFGYSFVETITDSARFNYYRNYFSGVEPVYCSTRSMFEEDSKGYKVSRFFIRPGFIHSEIYDSRGLPEKARTILSENFTKKAKSILTQDFNIDTMDLNYYSYEYNRVDTIIKLGPSFSCTS